MLSVEAYGQKKQNVITGKVVDENGYPLPGVNVVIEGTTKGSVTDFEGVYKLMVPNKQTILKYSSIGYRDQSIKVGERIVINVNMELDVKALDEIVVIGYGEQKKKEVTGAVGRMDGEELLKNATSDMASALQGQIAGVNVQASSGQPGAAANIMIRGLSSVTGSSTPLYVVDGVPFDGDPGLSPNEIATIDVLKDAASAAIYGTRGAAGVILITTKQGDEGEMKINFDGYYGIQKITSGVNTMNFEEYMYAENVRARHLDANASKENFWTPIQENPAGFTRNTNMTDVIMIDNAPVQNYSLTASGGKNGLRYSLTGNYFSQDGSVINSGFERLSVRSNSMYRKKKFTFSTNFALKREQRQYTPVTLLTDAYRYKPYQQEIDPNATETATDDENTNNVQNLAYIQTKLQRNDQSVTNQANYNFKLDYDVVKGLKLSTRFGGSVTEDTRTLIEPIIQTYNGAGELVSVNGYRSGVRQTSGSRDNWSWESTANFTKKIKGHSIKLLGVFSLESYHYNSFFGQRKDLISNDITVINGATSDNLAGNQTGYLQNRTNNLVGMLGRLQYNYKGRYLLSASVRRDGSSRFAEDYRWGLFPSVSVGWNVAEETFWKNNLGEKVNTFKFRGSYGTTGNQNFLDYSNVANIALYKDYAFGTGGSEALSSGAAQGSYANANVQWETTIQTNLGVDLGFFDNKLTVTADVYNTVKQDMLFPVLIPSSTGGGMTPQVILNVGNMDNRGMEFSANYKHVGKGDFSWNVGATYSRNENKITKMAGTNKESYMKGSEAVTIGGNAQDKLSVLKEGYEAGAFFLIKSDGILRTQQEVDEYNEIFNVGAKLGDLRLVDQPTVDTTGDGIPDSGDGVIDDQDRVYMGSGMPDYELGLNLGASYKGFDLSVQFYAAIGGEVINGNKAYAYQQGVHKDMVYQWSDANVNSNIPANRGGGHENYRGRNDIYIEDGSFARLRNVTLGYALPSNVTKKMGISKLRFYATAINPLTFTNYTGYDPEVGNNGLSTRGIDKGTYPVTASYRFGLQFGF
ncbi:SusC/RagA family TonB-linked outer membrane protein [Flammeovirga aprica]|uniref:TonB-dependent receptor n=1 Tax=Flammeovirga aprica JL-4 TaxID=694437 RepID=A0A7X9RWN9_9BACT|nr:TonB-dependent receptor [Flammeovirga aprica]NME70069.1 TonB-dependent receptor [Flammeovirga aprica JL-4]